MPILCRYTYIKFTLLENYNSIMRGKKADWFSWSTVLVSTVTNIILQDNCVMKKAAYQFSALAVISYCCIHPTDY